MRVRAIVLSIGLVALAAGGAAARARQGGGGVPDLDVKTSCSDAQKFSNAGDKEKSAFKGCMQDENNAKGDLAKKWSTFSGKDRQDCVEQGRTPSPSYVEVLTCLEMSSGSIRNAPKVDGQPVPQIGGTAASGLNGPTPSAPPPVH